MDAHDGTDSPHQRPEGLDEAVELLGTAGHAALAGHIEREIVGRNVIDGRWTFQIVEDYDDNCYTQFTDAERQAREQLAE